LVRRKKRKVEDGEGGAEGSSKEVEPAAAPAGVNVLVGRKKAKS
jgi:hypothetical protein